MSAWRRGDLAECACGNKGRVGCSWEDEARCPFEIEDTGRVRCRVCGARTAEPKADDP